jgi:hypothetical protein
MVPSRVANIKSAAQPWNWKSDDPLNTIPVGEPGPFTVDGISTLRLLALPAPL